MAETAVRARSGPLAIPARRRAAAFPPRQAEVVNRVDEEMRAEMIECQACPPPPPIHTPPPASPSGVAPLAIAPFAAASSALDLSPAQQRRHASALAVARRPRHWTRSPRRRICLCDAAAACPR